MVTILNFCGSYIARVLSGKINHFPRANCGRGDCAWTSRESGCKEQCYKEGVGYSGHCTRCEVQQQMDGVAEEQVVDFVYHGETARTVYTRANQHYSDYGSHAPERRVKPKSSWMWDHTEKVHQGIISDELSDDYNFRVAGSFRDPLSRQLDESVRIGMVTNLGRVGGVNKKCVLLNRKDEHYQPRMVLPSFSNLGNLM